MSLYIINYFIILVLRKYNILLKIYFTIKIYTNIHVKLCLYKNLVSKCFMTPPKQLDRCLCT